MSETNMPTAEVEVAAGTEDERASYELAFHILPTVVEGEVPTIFDAIKAAITKAGGEVIDEEVPQRFDLAYEIVKHLEGKDRKFTSAYFGWIRFKAEPTITDAVADEMKGRQEVLRYLLIRLTKEEEATPFRFHESLADQKKVSNVDEGEVPTADVIENVEVETADAEEKMEDKVSEEDLEDVLKKSTV